MIMQNKYYMIVLLSVSSVSYGMQFNGLELLSDFIARDPLALDAARRKAEIRKTTQEINAACKVASGSNGHYTLITHRGPIRVVAPVKKQIEPPKPKL